MKTEPTAWIKNERTIRKHEYGDERISINRGGSLSRTSAVIVAAGSGSRMGGGIKKQFKELDGVPILKRTLAVFAVLPEIHEIILVVGNDDLSFCQKEFADCDGTGKMNVRLVEGGSNRQLSVRAGVEATDEDTEIVVVHDGVRPFIEHTTIRASIRAAENCGAACVAVPAVETIKRVRNGYIDSTPNRKELWIAQTPQCFRRGLFLRAMAEAERAGVTFTDDVSLIEWIGEPVEVVEGSYDNIKITTPKDLAVAEEIIRRRRNISD